MMRACTVGRVAARRDVCIFCAFRCVQDVPVATVRRRLQRRNFGSTRSSLRPPNPEETTASRKEADDDLPQKPAEGSGWGALGRDLGLDFTRPVDWGRPTTGSTQTQSQPKKDVPSAHLRDIIPPKRHSSGSRDVITPNGRIRRHNVAQRHREREPAPSGLSQYRPSFLTGNAEPAPDAALIGNDAKLGGAQESAVRDAPVAEKTRAPPRQAGSATNAPAPRVRRAPARGSIGGLEELMNHTENNARLVKQAQSNRDRPSRRPTTNSFEDAPHQRDAHYSWKPAKDEPVKSAAVDTEQDTRQPGATQEVDSRSSRRSARFAGDDDVLDASTVEPEVARPQRAKGHRRVHQQSFNAMDEFDEFDEGQKRRGKKGKKAQSPKVAAEPVQNEVPIPDFISVENLAKVLRVRIEDFIRRMEDMGFESPSNDHILDGETAGLIVTEYGCVPVLATSAVTDLVARPPPEDKSVLPARPPIITIMGHVDHGKTTILDYLRKSSVAASEHGGITQHIGAFSVRMPGAQRLMTFLDTPGHAAFLEMRRRGANVTDIVVLVVAADDGVKPQTIEAIKHALDANVQIIVAINKIDKHDANAENVKHDLTRYGIEVEDVGGNIQAIPVSGKTGQGMEDLEEAILALSEAEDYRAEADGQAEGWVIEANVTQAGRLATVLVRRGTLRPGDYIVAGTTWARIRSLRDDAGHILTEAPPGTPVRIDGWRDQPMAGFEVLQAESEQHAKEVVDMRLEREEIARMTGDASAINIARKEEAEERARVLAWEAEQGYSKMSAARRPKDNEGWVEPTEDSSMKTINVVVKADVTGSVEAVVHAITSLGNSEVTAKVIRSGVGPVNLSDIQHVSATGSVGNGYIVSFNQPIDSEMYRLASSTGVELIDHNIIYRVTDTIREKLADQLPPIIKQKVHGEASIDAIFSITVKKELVKIAGCKVTNGTISRDRRIRVSRGDADNQEVVFEGKLSSLKNVKKDVTEMRKGNECGMGFEGWFDFEVGDSIQSFEEIRERRVL